VNERIQQFAEQARTSVPAGLDTVEWIAEYNRIFAELIVRECIKTYNDDGYQTEHEQDQRVLKHFGVE
jgi:hypothetical protein